MILNQKVNQCLSCDFNIKHIVINIMKIIVLGGCGYVGSVLVKKLLDKQYKLLVIDTQWFGNYLKPHKNLKLIKKDIRNLEKFPSKDIKQ